MARKQRAITDKDLGYRDIVGRLLGAGDVAVTVGVHSDAPPSEDGVPVSEYATINEFGSSDGRVPERSFLRSTLDRNQTAYIKGVADAIDKNLAGQHLNFALLRLGQRVVKDVRETIESGVGPANAPSTIERKGHGATLQDSGGLSDAITARVEVAK